MKSARCEPEIRDPQKSTDRRLPPPPPPPRGGGGEDGGAGRTVPSTARPAGGLGGEGRGPVRVRTQSARDRPAGSPGTKPLPLQPPPMAPPPPPASERGREGSGGGIAVPTGRARVGVPTRLETRTKESNVRASRTATKLPNPSR